MGGHGALWLCVPASRRFRSVRIDERRRRHSAFPEQLEDQRAARTLFRKSALVGRAYGDRAVVSRSCRSRTVTGKSLPRRPGPVDYSLQPGQLAIVIDCGTEDYFFEVNRQLHERMLYRHISHEYIVRPGGHTHDYWREAVEYHMLFFRRFFDSQEREDVLAGAGPTVIRGLRLSHRIVVLGVAADVGSGIGTDRPDPQVFGARVFEGGRVREAAIPCPSKAGGTKVCVNSISSSFRRYSTTAVSPFSVRSNRCFSVLCVIMSRLFLRFQVSDFSVCPCREK